MPPMCLLQYFNGDPWKCDMSPCDTSKEKILSYKSTTLTSCLEAAGAAHSGRPWCWSKEAERMWECAGLARKHTWLPLTEKGWNDGASVSVFDSASVCTQQVTHTGCPRNEVGLGDMYICVYLEVRGLQRRCSLLTKWQREKKKGT